MLPVGDEQEDARPDHLRHERAEQAAERVAGKIDIRWNARGQPGLCRLEGQAGQARKQRRQDRGAEATGQAAQRERQKKAQRQVDCDIGREIEGGPVARPATFKEGKG